MQQLKSALEMPGSFGVPIISDLQFAGNEGYSLVQSWQRYGSVFKMRLLGQKCAVLIGAEANKLVLVDQAERFLEELKQVVKGELNIEHLRQLPQMTNFLKEIERLYPPTSLIIRGVVKEIEYAGYPIEPGWTIIISQLVTHRLPEIYTNSEQFDPDRFALGRKEDKKSRFHY
ncbi:MAG: cytochrome P450 [Calothrix sp. FI2-JRJ7]|jgi:hypothetical protein|nr:cytochrome P450 [Calothrix sp. FI2-JRJ7]